MTDGRHTWVNFGGNVRFRPQDQAAPHNETELLELLAKFRGRRIHAIGRLHSWSESAASDDVLLDLRHFDQVSIERRGDEVWATIGAGCTIRRALAQLRRQADATLPTMGLVDVQSLAGAISTGTHGSGRHSISHYVSAVRLAHYDAAGVPHIHTITGGDELRALRCAVGTCGLIVAVTFQCPRVHRIEEHFRRYDSLADALVGESSYELQQFYWIPWSWKFFVQHRRRVDAPRSRLAALYRTYWRSTIDVNMHLVLRVLARWLRTRRGMKGFFRHVAGLFVLRKWRVVDRSDRLLLMKHELFQHIEIEMFVPARHLNDSLTVARQLIEYCDGEMSDLGEDLQRQLTEAGLAADLAATAAPYTHHYPICVRKVLPDDTLISPAAGAGEPYYAVSFISYAAPSDRAGFLRFARLIGAALSRLFDARPHWGKICPLSASELSRLYPQFETFRRVRSQLDPTGVFSNAWTAELFSAADDRTSN